MERFAPAPLSSAKLPILLDGEVELKSVQKVSILLQKEGSVISTLFHTGTLYLTNIRLITVSVRDKSSALEGWGLQLKEFSKVEDCASFFRRSTRLRICFSNHVDEIGLKFEDGQKEELLNTINSALQKKSWVGLENKKKETNEPIKFSASNAGVGGIIRRQEQTMQNVDNIAKSATSDLDNLMKQAREVIQVVERYAQYSQEASGEGSCREDELRSEVGSQISENNEMELIMQSIGIISPVTKFSAGRLYHQQLARQIVDLLLKDQRLERLGGMISLTDLFCLFNRARGTELISPDDLLKSCFLLEKLKLGVKLRIFTSGVKVLELESYEKNKNFDKILNLLEENEYFRNNGIQASDIASFFSISLIVAKEQILLAEENELLCRDESIHGLCFYPNKFTDF